MVEKQKGENEGERQRIEMSVDHELQDHQRIDCIQRNVRRFSPYQTKQHKQQRDAEQIRNQKRDFECRN